MSHKLAGKVALITGGTSGLGFATAKRFVAEGAEVYITGRRLPSWTPPSRSSAITPAACRATSRSSADLDKLFDTIRKKSGRLDVLFANAGGGAFAPLGEITEEHFDKYFGINVKGTLFTVQKALPLMPAGSAIVLNGSMVSIKGFPAFGVYCRHESGAASFARTWAVDLKSRQIRVNVVSPGTVVTPGYKNELGLSDDQIRQFEAQAAATTPLGRAGTPDEIAKAVLFLASDDSSYINGVELFVDGGAAQV